MAVHNVKSSNFGLAKGSLAFAAVLGTTSAVALPAIKGVGYLLLGAVLGFTWPITLMFAGGFVLAAVIAFVAYKLINGTEKGNDELGVIEKRADERNQKEEIERKKILEGSLQSAQNSVPAEKEEDLSIKDFVNDMEQSIEFRRRLVARDEYTPEEIDAIFEFFKDLENFQRGIENEEYGFLLGLVDFNISDIKKLAKKPDASSSTESSARVNPEDLIPDGKQEDLEVFEKPDISQEIADELKIAFNDEKIVKAIFSYFQGDEEFQVLLKDGKKEELFKLIGNNLDQILEAPPWLEENFPSKMPPDPKVTYENEPKPPQEPEQEENALSWQERWDNLPPSAQQAIITGLPVLAVAGAAVAAPAIIFGVPLYTAYEKWSEKREKQREFFQYLAEETEESRTNILKYADKDPLIQEDIIRGDFETAVKRAKNAEALDQLRAYLERYDFERGDIEFMLNWAKQLPWFEVSLADREKHFADIVEAIERGQTQRETLAERKKQAIRQLEDRLKDFYIGYKEPILGLAAWSWFEDELGKRAIDADLSPLFEEMIRRAGGNFIRSAVHKQRGENDSIFSPHMNRAFERLEANLNYNQLVLEGKWNTAIELAALVVNAIEKEAEVERKRRADALKSLRMSGMSEYDWFDESEVGEEEIKPFVFQNFEQSSIFKVPIISDYTTPEKPRPGRDLQELEEIKERELAEKPLIDLPIESDVVYI